MIGRDGLHPPYAAFVSTGAARATQMVEVLRHAAGQDDMPVTPAPRTSGWLTPTLVPCAALSLPGAAPPRAARQECPALASCWHRSSRGVMT